MKQTARQFVSRPLQAFMLVLAFTLSITAAASARAGQQDKFPKIHIKNFGQMDERFYRGAQPRAEDFKDLAALGIKTVIDLRDDPASYEKAAAESAGLHYVNIPMSDTRYPKEEQIKQFLKLATNPATGAFYVHCAGGRHRTGVAGAVYRMTVDGWNYDRTYGEMKNYDFYTRWGHGAMKDYVADYWKKVQVGQIQVLNK
ncbi:MAG TPA: tyrosine-protein phosphatase [Blastocatellia bacterium]